MESTLGAIYQKIASDLLNCNVNQKWDKLVLTSDILKHNASSITFCEYHKNIASDVDIEFDTIFSINDSLVELRDVLLDGLGHRIWGLVFTLYPDGKFEIEYDYNKPEDYEETDGIITAEEISDSLQNLFK
ncbi:DUF600 family protein [Moraxella nasovis]|uniref:immunity protein YezG family protein n=1 Tax=Moraxella nasovis TaxID=2904121 RepID=UPI001F60FE91|nr:immunity protein YezG family protein [Moraxella nasovis]UNU73349.1 DUF600 family protein [Moraxella nasovis]